MLGPSAYDPSDRVSSPCVAQPSSVFRNRLYSCAYTDACSAPKLRRMKPRGTPRCLNNKFRQATAWLDMISNSTSAPAEITICFVVTLFCLRHWKRSQALEARNSKKIFAVLRPYSGAP